MIRAIISKFGTGVVIGSAIFGVILGTLLLVAKYESWTPAYWVAAAIIVPLIIRYPVADSGRDNSVKAFLRFITRLYWQHIVLASYIFCTALVAYLAFALTSMEGMKRKHAAPVVSLSPEAETYFEFHNSISYIPRLLWGGVVLAWQLTVIAGVLFFEQVYALVSAYPVVFATAAVLLYGFWLVSTTKRLWKDEFIKQVYNSINTQFSTSEAVASTGYWLK